VAKSGYGKKKLPKGQAWGVAVHESFNTVIAYVVVASVVEGAPSCTRSRRACIATWPSIR
jgi:isoquinoline 1-oxidoreductase beta subunit